MNRSTFLRSIVALPVSLNLLFRSRAQAAETVSPAKIASSAGNEGTLLTTDVFAGDFPPQSYGESMEAVESTIQQVVERVFRDEDGMLRSGVNGRTMKPLRPEEVKDHPHNAGLATQHSAIPDDARRIWMNYENAGQATGTYLKALCIKARVTKSPEVRELARKTFAAILLLWNNAAAVQFPLGGTGRGWLPKPYKGIRHLDGIYECSVDQYCDITLGLHAYHDTLADEGEKRQIEQIITSFAHWWFDHDYCGVYFGQPIWWKRIPWHSMAAAYFLYVNALAHTWSPSPKTEQGFKVWMGLNAALQPPGAAACWLGMPGMTLEILEALVRVKPEHKEIWMAAAAYQVKWLAKCIAVPGNYNIYGFAAGYLVNADQLFPGEGHDKESWKHLTEQKVRGDFYHIRRGEPIARISQKGDDYRDVFWCEGHAHWLAAYWHAKEAGFVATA